MSNFKRHVTLRFAPHVSHFADYAQHATYHVSRHAPSYHVTRHTSYRVTFFHITSRYTAHDPSDARRVSMILYSYAMFRSFPHATTPSNTSRFEDGSHYLSSYHVHHVFPRHHIMCITWFHVIWRFHAYRSRTTQLKPILKSFIHVIHASHWFCDHNVSISARVSANIRQQISIILQQWLANILFTQFVLSTCKLQNTFTLKKVTEIPQSYNIAAYCIIFCIL